jgi:hypothetical protein
MSDRHLGPRCRGDPHGYPDCEENFEGRYELKVFDLYQQPTLAKGEQIIAAPTPIKKLPLQLRRVIGDMANTERVLVGLDLRAKKEEGVSKTEEQWAQQVERLKAQLEDAVTAVYSCPQRSSAHSSRRTSDKSPMHMRAGSGHLLTRVGMTTM